MQERVCRVFGATLAALLEASLAKCDVVYFIGITLEDVHLNRQNFFFLLVLRRNLLWYVAYFSCYKS